MIPILPLFVIYYSTGTSAYAKYFLMDKIPTFLLAFSCIFLGLMVLLFTVIKTDYLTIVAVPSFIIAVVTAWYVVRGIIPGGISFGYIFTNALVPLMGVALIIVMVAQILKFMA
ncbi:MAG: hypothetical protein ABH829_00870 [archaeon]